MEMRGSCDAGGDLGLDIEYLLSSRECDEGCPFGKVGEESALVAAWGGGGLHTKFSSHQLTVLKGADRHTHMYCMYHPHTQNTKRPRYS